MSKPIVLVTGPVATRSGYGNHTRDICRALIEIDKYDVRIQSMRWGNTPMNALEEHNPIHKEIHKRILRQPNIERQPEVHLQISVPNEFQPLAKKNIGVTAGIEHTIPPAPWVEGLNRMDVNIITSEWSAVNFKNVSYDKKDQGGNVIGQLKVNSQLTTLFEGADPDIYKETNEFSKQLVDEFNKITTDWNFLYTGHWLQGGLGEDRKDVGMMIKVFLESFKNKKDAPGLILKTSSAGFSVVDREEIRKKVDYIKSEVKAKILPKIWLLHGDLTDDEMNGLYNHPKVKAHLSFTHGEGFGRPLLEASFSGKPILAPIATGQADFLDKMYTVELPHIMTKVPTGAFPKEYHNPEAGWATVNYGIASKLMREVYQNYPKYQLKGKKQMLVNRQMFTHEKMSEKLISIVDKMLEGVPQQVQLKIPSLTKEPKKLKLPTLKKG